MRSFVDTLTALVPAEVLAAHAAILSATTTTTNSKGTGGKSTTTINDPATLKWSFFALAALSVALYIFPRWGKGNWGGLDYVRAVIPPLAFTGWTMLQKGSAFDAVAPSLSIGERTAIAVIGAALLSGAAARLAYKADLTSNQPPPVGS